MYYTTPEFAISVYPEYEEKAFSTRAFLSSSWMLFMANRIWNESALSNLIKSNYAVDMYLLKPVFEILEEKEDDYLMVKRWKNE